MLKRATIDVPLRGGTPERELGEVPVGRCWIMEGKMWATVIWADGGVARSTEFPMRAYDKMKSSGFIRFDPAQPPGHRPLYNRIHAP